MQESGNVIGEIVKRCEETKKLGKNWIKGKCKNGIPDKESGNRKFGNRALFPSDFGMCDISHYSGDSCGNER